MDWLNAQDPTVKVAIIGVIGTISAAIIAGIFSLLSNRKKSDKSAANNKAPHTINQTSSGIGNTQIGIQNNYYEEDSNGKS